MSKPSAKTILGLDHTLPPAIDPGPEKAVDHAVAEAGGAAAGPVAGQPHEVVTGRPTESEQRSMTNRPVGPGAGIHRGDRRDPHPLFTTGKTNTAGGKRGPIGNSTRRGGTND